MKEVSAEVKKIAKLNLSPAEFKRVRTMVSDAPFSVAILGEDEELRNKLLKAHYAVPCSTLGLNDDQCACFERGLQRLLSNENAVFLTSRIFKEINAEDAPQCEVCHDYCSLGVTCPKCKKIYHLWCN